VEGVVLVVGFGVVEAFQRRHSVTIGRKDVGAFSCAM